MTRENITSQKELEELVKASGQRSKRRRQFNEKQRLKKKRRRRGRVFFLLLTLILVFFLVGKIRELFFTDKLTNISDLRTRANEEMLSDYLASDTTGRPLKEIEKKSDALKLKALLLKTPNYLANNGKIPEKALDTFVEAASRSTSDEEFILILQDMIDSVQKGKGSLVSSDRLALLNKNLGHGFYTEDSPYGQALQSERVKDRYERTNIKELSSYNNDKNKQADQENEEKRVLAIQSPKDCNLVDFKQVEISFDNNLNVAIIRNLAFEDGALDGQAKKLADIFESASPYKHVVLDLRNSAGSSLEFWSKGILPYFSPLPFGIENKIYFSEGAREYADFFSIKEKMSSFDLENSESKLTEAEQADEKLKGISFVKKQTISNAESSSMNLSQLPILLVDETTYGAAESFADYCSRNQLALVYGRKSSGSAWNLPAYLFVLPHSGLLVELEMSLAMAPSEEVLQAESGIKDMKILEGDDLMQALMVELQK